MKAILIVTVLFSTHAFAQMKTPFDTLSDAFHNASTPATVQDFEQGRWENCVFSDIGNPMMTRPTQVRTLEIESQGGNGPLLPGGGDVRIDVFNDYGLDRNLYSFFQHSRIDEQATELVQTLDGPPWRRMNIFGRTDKDMLLFYVELSDYYGPQAPMYPRVYGYCWNEVSPIPPSPN